MKCKYCEAEMAQWGAFCPACGRKNDEEEPLLNEQEIVFSANEAQELSDCPEAAEDWEAPETEETEEPSPALKKAKRMAAMSGCVALLAVLATVLFFGIRGGWDVDSWFNWLKPRENTVAYRDNYTVDDKKIIKKRDVVVAAMGDLELTNAQLQIYYWQEVYDFLDNYYYYLSYIGMDYTQPLDQQTCYFNKELTWQQYFIDSAIQTWQSNTALTEQAKAEGFVMPEEYREELDGMVADLTERAMKNGYASVDAMVQESFGAGCTVQDYMEYMENFYMGYLYFTELYEAIDPTMEEIEAYFTANEQTLTADGVKKDDSYTVDVRHILIKIETIAKEMEKNEAGEGADAQAEEEEKYTDAQWEACLAAAQKIYDEYLAGELTEERFGELAKKYTEDGNAEQGGLYTFVAEGDMVETFNDWCFDPARQVGDTGLVKTQFGYHVMYFVGTEATWITQTRSAYVSEKSNEIVANALSKYTVDINYKKIVLADVAL